MKRMPYEGDFKKVTDALLLFHMIVAGFKDAQAGVREVEKDIFGEEVSNDGTDLIDQIEFHFIVKRSLREELIPLWDWFIGNVPKDQKPALVLASEAQVAKWDAENGGQGGVAF